MRRVSQDLVRTTRPLEFDENLEVLGSIRSGARLEVRGNLSVAGDVEDARIVARGSVFIDGGFIGSGGSVVCDQSFTARFIQGQRVEAGGDVVVEKGVLSGEIFASGRVTVENPQGAIVGGRIHAGSSVEAAEVGSSRPVMTRILVGLDPVLGLKLETLEQEAMELTRRRVGLMKDALFVGGARSRSGSGEKLMDLKSASDAMHGDIVAVGEAIVEMRKSAAVRPDATVVVRSVSHPPLEVSIGFSKLMVERSTGPVTFRLFEDRIIEDTWNLR
jgi:uncharacterized protein (DUF342 family)